MDISAMKARKKELKMTLDEISAKSGIPKRTVEDIFREATKNPRVDTVQAIEAALGLAPYITDAETKQGVNIQAKPVVLSDRANGWLGILYRADQELGEEYVDKYLELLNATVEQKLNKKPKKN